MAGGIGIVRTFVAAPLVGFGATQLHSAEVASAVVERLFPRTEDTATSLVYAHGTLTLGGVVALWLAGMGPLGAANHALPVCSWDG